MDNENVPPPFRMLVVLLLGIALTGCSAPPVEETANDIVETEKWLFEMLDSENHANLTTADTRFIIWEDSETHVQYIYCKSGYSGGMCPRYNADGSLYVGGAENGKS